jgi:hypothetical protein
MKSLLTIVLLIVSGCGPAAQNAETSAGALVVWRERVVSREAWLDVGDAPWSVRRVSRDPGMGGFYILVSSSGRFCPVDARTWNEVQDGAYFTCAWRWLN